MARVYVAEVTADGPDAAMAAMTAGVDALGPRAGGRWTLVSAPREGLSRDERALPGQLRELLGGEGGRAGLLRAVSRGAGLARYQLTVGHPGERVEAHADLYTAGPIAWLAQLGRDATLQGPGGALATGAAHLLLDDLDALQAEARQAALSGLLEVGDPDLVVGDGRTVSLGAAADAPRRHRLGLVLVADNALAHDVVWAWMLGVSPEEVRWIRALADQGFGPGRIDDVELSGADPALFRRRLEGFATPPRFAEVGLAFQRDLGVALPIEVMECRAGPAAARAEAWLACHTEDPERREELKDCPPLSLLAGARRPGVVPSSDRVLAVGPAAAEAMLTDVHVDRARPRSRSFLAHFWRRTSADVWDLRLSDGRDLVLAALDEVAPTPARIGRAAAMLARRRSLAWPRESRLDAIRAWVLRRLRRVRLPAPVVHARRIHRLQARPWRRAKLAGPALREET